MKISRSQSLVLAAATLALFFALSFALIRSGRETSRDHKTAGGAVSAPTPYPTPGAEGASIVLNQFHRSEVKDGKKMWEVTAARGQLIPETQTAIVEDAVMLFFQKSGDVVQLKARKATLALNGTALTKATIEGDVELVLNETRLTTDRAIFDKEKNTVYAPGRVVIRDDLNEVAGDELTADVASQVFTLAQNVETVIDPKPHGP